MSLKSYEVGDLPEGLGRGLMVNKRGNTRCIQGFADDPAGRIEIDRLALKGRFEVVFNLDLNGANSDLALVGDDGDSVLVRFREGKYSFGNTTLNWGKTGWRGGTELNLVRLTGRGKTVKLFINEQFFGTVLTPPSRTYVRLLLTGLQKDDIVCELRMRGE